jgi:hypothetical protein
MDPWMLSPFASPNPLRGSRCGKARSAEPILQEAAEDAGSGRVGPDSAISASSCEEGIICGLGAPRLVRYRYVDDAEVARGAALVTAARVAVRDRRPQRPAAVRSNPDVTQSVTTRPVALRTDSRFSRESMMSPIG